MSEHIQTKTFARYGIEIRPVCVNDLPSLRRWRNSPLIAAQMMCQEKITPAQQVLWFKSICKGKQDQAHWVVYYKNVRTGYMKIVGNHLLENAAQLDVGAYVGNSVVRQGLLGYAIVLLQLDIAFDELNAQRVQMSVKKNNVRAHVFNRQFGYREFGQDSLSIFYQLDKESYQVGREKLKRYFN